MRNKDELSSTCHKVDTTVRAPARRNALDKFAMPSCPCSGPDRRIARRKNYQIGIEPELHDFRGLQKSVLSGRAVAQQNQSRSIWKCGVRKPVNSEMNDAVFGPTRRAFEGGFSCRRPQQQLAFLS